MKNIWNADIKVGNNMLDYMADPVDRNKAKTNFDRTFKGESFTIIEQYGDTALNRRWYKDIYNPLYDSKGYIIGLTLFLSDITELKENESALQLALHQKDSLMRELNRRVKNNLNMVSALISLKDSETEEDLSDLKHRIDAIKLIHEKLHPTDDIDHIKINDYFQEILGSIFISTSERKIDVVNQIGDLIIPTKTAVPLGLILNEIATNAMKYEFTAGDAGDDEKRFTVTLTKDKESSYYIFTLSNTGNPFPKEVDFTNPDTMGLQLVAALVEQVDGSIELQKEPCPTFIIRFSITE